MYRISELAQKVGLSRTALLYYEKLELISGVRLNNGYRVYSDKDVQRVLLIQTLQAAGLTLKECKGCLEAKIDRTLLLSRLGELDKEIEQKQHSRGVLAALLGEGDHRAWHETANQVAPDAHLDWLIKQGFDEKEALRLKWLSKDMNEHQDYMTDFMKVYETLDRWGPGSEQQTLDALNLVPLSSRNILEIGSGKGLATTVLANNTQAQITVVDNEQSALDRLSERFTEDGLNDRISPVCASMTELPFNRRSFDLIWAEGSAYIMGVESALKQWRPLLENDGVMMFSDLVWFTDTRSPEAQAFWKGEYPDMHSLDTRLEQIKAAGYTVIEHFPLSQQAWENYFIPLKHRVTELTPNMPNSNALNDLRKEISIYERYLDEFGYEMFIIQKTTK
ncbi:methyltransferase [Vibrio inusitatus NBRC 102082]|uniref:Methyltransferase n=1 Tax=Vibrio inusitatus NBRC 102082 TaxID=1219070 RepID=A0A4Y3HR53_9VIBR|nr:MerR family transcriptional regulator [Vibrio inusitatus]GEA49623.1 methyltransferase [Vibrio inusitatus NBRC 102082]